MHAVKRCIRFLRDTIMFSSQLSCSSAPFPHPLAYENDSLTEYVRFFRKSVYDSLTFKARTDLQKELVSSLRTTGYYCQQLNPTITTYLNLSIKKTLSRYRMSHYFLKDLCHSNTFRTLPLSTDDKSTGYFLLQNLIHEAIDFLHISSHTSPAEPYLQLTKIKNSNRLPMSDVHDFHVDAVFPTFKSFIFFPGSNDACIPYEFSSFGLFCEEDLTNFHSYVLEASAWFFNSFGSECKVGRGQLTWMYSTSLLNQYRLHTGNSCSLLDKFDNTLPNYRFLTRAPILLISDNSLPHRRSWCNRSKLRIVCHFLPYERVSLSDWISHSVS